MGDAGDDRSRIVEAQRIIHQMSNSVLLMRSVMRRSAETAENVEEYVMRLESRTDTIVRVLVALVRDPARTFGLRELIEDELEAQGAFHHGGARLFGGPPLHLRPAAAQVLALVFQELVTNSFQHGALGGECGGQLHVSWEIVEDGRLLQLDWAEQGRHAPWAGRGFGTMVLESVLSYQLDGRVERSFSARGLRIRLTIPVAILTADQESCC